MDNRHHWTVGHSQVWAAWQEQVRQAVRRPWLLRALLHAETRSRFFTCYAHLRALPRQTRRALQRRLAQSLAGLALLLALGQGHALADTINVTDGCTLVDAITAANTDMIAGGCTAGSGADTPMLDAGSTHTLTAAIPSAYGDNGLLVVTTTITIEGNGSTTERGPLIDHFKCYTVKVSKNTPKFVKGLQASVVDQFNQAKSYDVVKPTRLCTPADKDGESPGAENHAEHLLCYQVKPIKGAAKHVKVLNLHVNNQFGPERVDTIKEEELCLPSSKTRP